MIHFNRKNLMGLLSFVPKVSLSGQLWLCLFFLIQLSGVSVVQAIDIQPNALEEPMLVPPLMPSELPYPPEYSSVDDNGVDMVSGRTRFNIVGLSIGQGALTLEHQIVSDSNGFNPLNPLIDNFTGGIGVLLEFGSYTPCGSTFPYLVGIAGSFERFCLVNGEYRAALNRGSQLYNNGNGTLTYINRDGVRYTIDRSLRQVASDWGNLGLITRIDYPDGRQVMIHRRVESYYSSNIGANINVHRVQSVTLNNGLQLKYVYPINGLPSASNRQTWQRFQQVIAINNAEEYCAPTADTCSLVMNWPIASYEWSNSDRILTVTDSAGRVTRYTHDEYSRVTGIKPPSASTDVVSYDYCPHVPGSAECEVVNCSGGVGSCSAYNILDRVRGSVNNGEVWTYEYVGGIGGGNVGSYESRHPLGGITRFNTAQNSGLIREAMNRFGQRYVFTPDVTNLLLETQLTSGATLSYTYDGRGNVLTIRQGMANDPSAPLLFSAGYPTQCVNPTICNQPQWTRDANGQRTDYTYDAQHGGVTSITGPAVDGIRPQTRISYQQHQARIKNAVGQVVTVTPPIWLRSRMSECRSSAATPTGCAQAGDEVITAYEYGSQSGLNNLFLRGSSISGDGELRRSCQGVNRLGQTINQTLPAAGLSQCL